MHIHPMPCMNHPPLRPCTGPWTRPLCAKLYQPIWHQARHGGLLLPALPTLCMTRLSASGVLPRFLNTSGMDG